MADQATDTASAALLKEMADEMSHEIYLAGNHPMLGVDRVLVRRWRDRILGLLASLPAPAAPVIVVQVPDGWRVAQWDGQRYVSIGLPYPTERQANSDCALILARVQPTVESRLP